jgi:hypothetical protein
LTEIRPEVQTVDPTLATALDTTKRKILHNVQRLKSQVVRLETTNNSMISTVIDLVMNSCYPNQKLQERELGIQHFWIHHGSSITHAIRSSLDARYFSHRVLRLL